MFQSADRPTSAGPIRASALLLLLGGCQSSLPERAPALIDMEEPLDLFQEPDDESQRLALPTGCFSGLELAEAPASLDSSFGGDAGAPGLEVMGVIENSPAARARLEPGDLLLEATLPGAEPIELRWPSQWRALELEQPPGTTLELLLDRAGREAKSSLVLEARSSAADRQAPVRYREEQSAGVVLRTPTEVEARSVDLAPGAGAVLVGLSRRSPWRQAGLRFGDLLTSVDGVPLDHPEQLLERLRMSKPNAKLELKFRRPESTPDGTLSYGAETSLRVRATERVDSLQEFHLPLLLRYTRQGPGRTRWSALLGLLTLERTPAAWRFGYLWFGSFGGGDTEALEEVGE